MFPPSVGVQGLEFGHIGFKVKPYILIKSTPRPRSDKLSYNNGDFTIKIEHFITPRVEFLVLRCGHIGHKVKMNYSSLLQGIGRLT